jgi:hypothetical protein
MPLSLFETLLVTPDGKNLRILLDLPWHRPLPNALAAFGGFGSLAGGATGCLRKIRFPS